MNFGIVVHHYESMFHLANVLMDFLLDTLTNELLASNLLAYVEPVYSQLL